MGKKVKSIQNYVYGALNIELLIFVLYVQGKKNYLALLKAIAIGYISNYINQETTFFQEFFR